MSSIDKNLTYVNLELASMKDNDSKRSSSLANLSPWITSLTPICLSLNLWCKTISICLVPLTTDELFYQHRDVPNILFPDLFASKN